MPGGSAGYQSCEYGIHIDTPGRLDSKLSLLQMYRYQCQPRRRHGMVRAETVVEGDDTSIELYCGTCNLSWTERPSSPTAALNVPRDPHDE